MQYTHGIIKIFKSAGVGNSYKNTLEPVGFGKIRTYNISIFDNLPLLTDDVPITVMGMFQQTIGVYKSRIFESINPFFWLEFILFMPRYIFEYFNVDPKNIFVKIAQILYWLISIMKILYDIFSA